MKIFVNMCLISKILSCPEKVTFPRKVMIEKNNKKARNSPPKYLHLKKNRARRQNSKRLLGTPGKDALRFEE